jgi:hypothetical protein
VSRPEDQPGWAWPQPSGGTEPAGGATSTSPSEAWTVPSPQAAAGAPRRRRGRGWLVALLLVLGFIVATGVAGTVLFVTRTLPPYRAAHDFVADVVHDQPGPAAHNLCSSDSATPEDAIQRVRRTVDEPGTFKTLSANPLGVDRSGDSATVDVSVTYEGSVSSRTYPMPVVREGGSWKACP